MSDVMQRIDELVKANEVVLFMKGSASFPMCGFSGRAIQVLKACGVDTKTVKTVNVLDDAEIRQGIKEYSNWPTIPQLYLQGRGWERVRRKARGGNVYFYRYFPVVDGAKVLMPLYVNLQSQAGESSEYLLTPA